MTFDNNRLKIRDALTAGLSRAPPAAAPLSGLAPPQLQRHKPPPAAALARPQPHAAPAVQPWPAGGATRAALLPAPALRWWHQCCCCRCRCYCWVGHPAAGARHQPASPVHAPLHQPPPPCASKPGAALPAIRAPLHAWQPAATALPWAAQLATQLLPPVSLSLLPRCFQTQAAARERQVCPAAALPLLQRRCQGAGMLAAPRLAAAARHSQLLLLLPQLLPPLAYRLHPQQPLLLLPAWQLPAPLGGCPPASACAGWGRAPGCRPPTGAPRRAAWGGSVPAGARLLPPQQPIGIAGPLGRRPGPLQQYEGDVKRF